MTKKAKVQFKIYDLLQRAVEEGCGYASYRFSKHLDGDMTLDDLDREALAAVFEDAVMNEVCEIVDFEEDT